MVIIKFINLLGLLFTTNLLFIRSLINLVFSIEFIFIWIGLWFLFKKKWSVRGRISVLILVLVLSSSLSTFLIGWMENKFPVLHQVNQDSDIILVLGSGGVPDPRLSTFQRLSSSALQRTLEGVRLWKKDPNKMLVFSSQGKPGFPSQAALYADVAKEMGVPKFNIRLIEKGVTTETEALDFISVFPEINRIILVTSAAHMNRATRIFEAMGVSVIPAPTDFQVLEHPGGNRSRLWPSFEAFGKWNTLIHEWVGLLWVEFRVRSRFYPNRELIKLNKEIGNNNSDNTIEYFNSEYFHCKIVLG